MIEGIIVGGIESAVYLFVARNLFGIVLPQPLVDLVFLLWGIYGIYQEASDVFKAASIITLLVAIFTLISDFFLFLTIP